MKNPFTTSYGRKKLIIGSVVTIAAGKIISLFVLLNIYDCVGKTLDNRGSCQNFDLHKIISNVILAATIAAVGVLALCLVFVLVEKFKKPKP